MTETQFDLITIGESLVEFSTNQTFKDAECLHKYYGGDSLVFHVLEMMFLRIIYFPVGKKKDWIQSM